MFRLDRVWKLAACGIAASAIDVAALIGLVELAAVPVSVSAFLAAAAGAAFQFIVNKRWCFADCSRFDVRQVGAYLVVCIGTWTFVALSVHVICALGAPYLAAKAIAAAAVFVAWSYPAQARFVFPTAPSVMSPEA
jgi:putative flippase GtrA